MVAQAAKDAVTQGVASGFAALATAFVRDSLAHMVPWLIATAAVVVCDLCFGIRKSMAMGEDIRVSKAVRRTMGKMVTYFSFVCMVCMVSVAAGADLAIDKWSCLLVCGIEFCSIVSNILKPKGYTLNIKTLVTAIASRAAKTDMGGIIEETDNDKDKGKGKGKGKEE